MTNYKDAPTWLFNLEGETALFSTQEEVNKAWEDGWFGPQNLATDSPLLSAMEWDTKQDLIEAVKDDARYHGLILRMKNTKEELNEMVLEFEEENGLGVE